MRRIATCTLLAAALAFSPACGVGSRRAGEPRPEHGTTTAPTMSQPGVPTTDALGSTLAAETIVLDEDSPLRTLDCAGLTVEVATSGGVVNLDGDCPTLRIDGSGNVVNVDRVGAIVFTGDNNFVNWSESLAGSQPDVDDSGTFNVVTQS